MKNNNQKLNICIVCYITITKVEFLSSHFTTYKIRDVSLKTPLFGIKWNIFISLGSTISHTGDCLLVKHFTSAWLKSNKQRTKTSSSFEVFTFTSESYVTFIKTSKYCSYGPSKILLIKILIICSSSY